MRLASLVLALGLALPSTLSGREPRPPVVPTASPPNIVYIVADDQGWKDVGFHGSDIKTPNIDRLATGGARLEQFYTQPFCTQARAALMTGRYPYRYGLQTLVIPSAGKYGLPTDEYLLPQTLRDAGYTTAIIGKWHLGHADRKYWPMQRGFDYQYGPLLGEIDYFTHSAHGTRDWFRNEKPVKEEGYVTTLLGDDAVRYIQKSGAKPFFLYLAFTSPHSPYQVPDKAMAQYASVSDPARRAYSAMITSMDDEIGKVIAALEQKKLRDNTIIVFQSDNGGPHSAKFTGEIDMSKFTIPPDNGPYREGKGTLYEGGTRVVAVANWPGHIAPGSVVDQPMHIVDMYPTLVGLAGGSVAKQKTLDGMDVWSTVSAGKPSPRREVVYDIEPFRAAIRSDNWKLIWKTTLPSQVELFDLASDPGEQKNLAAGNPQKVAELQKRLEELSRDAVPPLIFLEAGAAAKQGLFTTVVLPEDAKAMEEMP